MIAAWSPLARDTQGPRFNGEFWMIQWEFMGFHGDFQADSMGFHGISCFFFKWEHDLSMGFSSGKGGEDGISMTFRSCSMEQLEESRRTMLNFHGIFLGIG